MSRKRTFTDYPRNSAGLVDNFIGTAYDVVKKVHDNLEMIGPLAENISQDTTEANEAASRAKESEEKAKEYADSIESVADEVEKAKAWAEGTEPDGPGTFSAKEYSEIAGDNSRLDIGSVNVLPAGSMAQASITGPVGTQFLHLGIPTGPQGPQGPIGPQGPEGPVGPQGIQGIVGSQGPVGPQGPQGADGPEGPQGIQGIQGPQGLQGNSFTPDAIGLFTERSTYDNESKDFAFLDAENGVIYFKLSNANADWSMGAFFGKGPQGEMGVQGPQGIQGPQGPQGIQGPVGPIGPIGPEGPEGPVGPQGIQGPQGIAGDEGPQGPEGIQGPVGPKGDKGDKGDTGDTGPQGATGPIGATGPQGPQGPEGPQGPMGEFDATRTISTNNGLTGGGDLSQNRTFGLTGQALALHNFAGTGHMVRTAAATYAARSIAQGNGILVTNGNGVSGNPTIAANYATQAEAQAGTNTVKVMTPQRVAQAIAALGGLTAPTAGNTIVCRLQDAESGTTQTTYLGGTNYGNQEIARNLTVTVLVAGTIRCSLQHSMASPTRQSVVRVLKNGTQVQEWSLQNSGYTTRTVDVAVAVGDRITFQNRASHADAMSLWRNIRVLSGSSNMAVA